MIAWDLVNLTKFEVATRTHDVYLQYMIVLSS